MWTNIIQGIPVSETSEHEIEKQKKIANNIQLRCLNEPFFIDKNAIYNFHEQEDLTNMTFFHFWT